MKPRKQASVPKTGLVVEYYFSSISRYYLINHFAWNRNVFASTGQLEFSHNSHFYCQPGWPKLWSFPKRWAGCKSNKFLDWAFVQAHYRIAWESPSPSKPPCHWPPAACLRRKWTEMVKLLIETINSAWFRCPRNLSGPTLLHLPTPHWSTLNLQKRSAISAILDKDSRLLPALLNNHVPMQLRIRQDPSKHGYFGSNAFCTGNSEWLKWACHNFRLTPANGKLSWAVWQEVLLIEKDEATEERCRLPQQVVATDSYQPHHPATEASTGAFENSISCT